MQATAAEAVAAAMNATLPGIDANDENKTRAVFRFYCMVLASTSSIAVWLLTVPCDVSSVFKLILTAIAIFPTPYKQGRTAGHV